MNTEVKDVSEIRKNLIVTLTQAEVDAEYQAVVGQITKSVRIPGFRPGKAPANVVNSRYGKEINDELKQKVLNKAISEGARTTNLDVLQVVSIDDAKVEQGSDATISVTVDLRPSFELPEYAGIETTVKPVEVTDAEVDAVIENIRAERADFKVAERASQKGDYIKISYTGSVDGQPILELVPDKQIYGAVPQTWEEVEGENDGVIPGLGKSLAGLSVGDKKDVTVTFPAEFGAAEALAGKTAVYAVEVQEIRERILPELNEDFLKSLQVDDVEGLKTNIRNQLTGRKEQENLQSQRNQVLESLSSKVEFPLPQSLIDQEAQNMLRQFVRQNMGRGLTQEQIEKDKDQLMAGARKGAEGRVKAQFLLSKIAEKEEIRVTEQDIDGFLYREAMQRRTTPEKIVKELTKNRDQLRSIQQSIIFDKALDLLVSKATVTTAEAPAQA